MVNIQSFHQWAGFTSAQSGGLQKFDENGSPLNSVRVEWDSSVDFSNENEESGIHRILAKLIDSDVWVEISISQTLEQYNQWLAGA